MQVPRPSQLACVRVQGVDKAKLMLPWTCSRTPPRRRLGPPPRLWPRRLGAPLAVLVPRMGLSVLGHLLSTGDLYSAPQSLVQPITGSHRAQPPTVTLAARCHLLLLSLGLIPLLR